MKNLLRTSTFLTFFLFANLASAQVEVFRGSLRKELSLDTRTLLLTQSFSDVKINVDLLIDQPSIVVNLVGESQDKVDKYLREWSLNIVGSVTANVDINPRSSFASSRCVVSKINGVYNKLKGVCIEGLVLTVPANYNAKLLSDDKIIQIKNILDQDENTSIGAVIGSKSIEELKSNLKRASFSSDKQAVLQAFSQYQLAIGSSRLLLSDLISIVKSFSFDDDKIDAVGALLPFISEPIEAYSAVAKTLSFSSSKDTLRAMLLK